MRGDEPLSGRLNHVRARVKRGMGQSERREDISNQAASQQTCSRFRMRQFSGERFGHYKDLLPAGFVHAHTRCQFVS